MQKIYTFQSNRFGMDVYKRTFIMQKKPFPVLRKEYFKPSTEVIIVRIDSILCGSNEGVDEIPGLW